MFVHLMDVYKVDKDFILNTVKKQQHQLNHDEFIETPSRA